MTLSATNTSGAGRGPAPLVRLVAVAAVLLVGRNAWAQDVAPGALPPLSASDTAASLPSGIRTHPVGVRLTDVDTAARDTAANDTTTHRRRDHILLGMAIGTAAGAAIGYGLPKLRCIGGGDSESDELGCDWGSALGLVYGAAIGWFIGGIVGAYVERAHPGDPDRQVRIGAVPAGPRGMAVTVSVR